MHVANWRNEIVLTWKRCSALKYDWGLSKLLIGEWCAPQFRLRVLHFRGRWLIGWASRPCLRLYRVFINLAPQFSTKMKNGQRVTQMLTIKICHCILAALVDFLAFFIGPRSTHYMGPEGGPYKKKKNKKFRFSPSIGNYNTNPKLWVLRLGAEGFLR